MPTYNTSDIFNLSEQKTAQPTVFGTLALNDSFDIRVILASVTLNTKDDFVLDDGQKHNVLEFNYILLREDT